MPNMLGPLPEGLRMGMYEAYGYCRGYSEFMRCVLALQEGTMSLEVADNGVFDIMGYDQGPNFAMPRSAATVSHRPDLYRMFVQWSTAAPPAPGVDINVPAPGPEAMRPEVCPELVLHELAFHQKVLEQLADKVHRMETNFASGHVVHGMENCLHKRVDTKMPPIPDMVRTAPGRVVGQKSIPLSSDMPSVPGPLPEGLRKRVYEAYSQQEYALFMRRTVALQEGTMSLEEVDAYVFSILGFEGGTMERDCSYRPFRDASSKSHRPDLYRLFVEWSTAEASVVKKDRKSDPFKFGVIGLPTASPMNFGTGGNTSGGFGVSGPPTAPPMNFGPGAKRSSASDELGSDSLEKNSSAMTSTFSMKRSQGVSTHSNTPAYQRR